MCAFERTAKVASLLTVLATMFPAHPDPAQAQGRRIIALAPKPAELTPYEAPHRPHWTLSDVLDFIGDVVNGEVRGGAFVTDDRGFANIIRGQGRPRPPDTNLGHFHLDYGEFWYILEGQIDYLIEGVPFFSAHEGDVVYVPKGRYHRASYGGEGMATRLAINGYPDGLHNYEPPEPD